MELQNVYKVYSGKSGRCMCGCTGKYRVATAHKAYAESRRGYSYSDDDVSDRSVKIIFNKVLRNPNKKTEDNFVYVEENDRILVAYFKE